MSVSNLPVLSMSVAEKVAAFAPHHDALAAALDELDELENQLPELESELAALREVILEVTACIAEGRAELRRDRLAARSSSPMSGDNYAPSNTEDGSEDDARARSPTPTGPPRLSLDFHLVDDGAAEKVHMLGVDPETDTSRSKTPASDMTMINSEEDFATTAAELDEQEAEVEETKRLQTSVMQKVYEYRDRLEPYERLCVQLDAIYASVFSGAKPETPELELFEWEVKCATHCKKSTESQYEAEAASLKAIKATHATLIMVHKELSIVRAMAEAGHIERDTDEAGEEEEEEERALQLSDSDRRTKISLSLGIIDALKPKLARELEAVIRHLRATPGRRRSPLSSNASTPTTSSTQPDSLAQALIVSLPHTDPVRHATQTLVRLESGMKLSVVPRVLRVTKGMQHCAIKEGLCASAATVRDAVRRLGIERESAQRRYDRLAAEIAHADDILNTEARTRRLLRRAIFERIAASNTPRSPSDSNTQREDSREARAQTAPIAASG